jgi:hypothetical protein
MVLVAFMDLTILDVPAAEATNGAITTVTWELPMSKNMESVKSWAREHLTRPEFVKVSNASTNMLVILARAGWGRPSTSMVYLYSLDTEDNVWRPRLVWNSNEEEIRVETTRRERELVFKSKKGRALMTLPIK